MPRSSTLVSVLRDPFLANDCRPYFFEQCSVESAKHIDTPEQFLTLQHPKTGKVPERAGHLGREVPASEGQGRYGAAHSIVLALLQIAKLASRLHSLGGI